MLTQIFVYRNDATQSDTKRHSLKQSRCHQAIQERELIFRG